MERIPPLSSLRAFEAVARLGSVVKAADELHVTHSAVSHQLRAIEEELGVALFERMGKRLSLNENGRVYAVQVRLTLAELARATGALRALPREDELVIGTIPSFGAHWLVPRLPGFLAAHPQFHVSVRATLKLENLEMAGVDAAIRMGSGGWEDVQQRMLFADRLVVVASPDFNGGRLPRTPAEVMRAPIVRSIESWRPWQEAAGLPPKEPRGLAFNDSNLLLEAVRLGLGVALTRQSLVFDALAQGHLVQLSPISVAYPTPYWFVWPARNQGRRKLEAFSSWLQDAVDRYLAAVGDAATGADGAGLVP